MAAPRPPPAGFVGGPPTEPHRLGFFLSSVRPFVSQKRGRGGGGGTPSSRSAPSAVPGSPVHGRGRIAGPGRPGRLLRGGRCVGAPPRGPPPRPGGRAPGGALGATWRCHRLFSAPAGPAGPWRPGGPPRGPQGTAWTPHRPPPPPPSGPPTRHLRLGPGRGGGGGGPPLQGGGGGDELEGVARPKGRPAARPTASRGLPRGNGGATRGAPPQSFPHPPGGTSGRPQTAHGRPEATSPEVEADRRRGHCSTATSPSPPRPAGPEPDGGPGAQGRP